MKISEIRIQNLRGYRDQTIKLNDYTCLLGPNGAGKSTILCALCIFFRDSEHFSTSLHALQTEDFNCQDTSQHITITVTFVDLAEVEQLEFKDYFRQGKLVITAEAKFDPVKGVAEVRQYGQRMGMKALRPFFAAEGENRLVPELKAKYEEIRARFPDLPPPGTKPAMKTALIQYEARHPELCELLPSHDEFYGFTGGANRLQKFVQWVYIPAVKDAAAEQTESKNTALGKLLERTVRTKTNFDAKIEELRVELKTKYTEILQANQTSLEGISSSLRTRLKEWAHPDARVNLEWKLSAERAIRVDQPLAQLKAGEGEFDGDISRFGHGLQRCYLLALLQELSGTNETKGPRLILGCEEPELHQHPPQARHLSDVLQRLSQGNSQILVTTHSPYFVSGYRFQDVRMIRKDHKTKHATVSQVTMEQLAGTLAEATRKPRPIPSAMALKMQQALLPSLNEMFFTKVLVLVEGLEDVAYITAYLTLLEKWIEFRQLGCHLVAAEGKSRLLQPIVIAKHLAIPVFVVFDADADKPDKNGSRTMHTNDNAALLRLRDHAEADPMPAKTFWSEHTVMWHSDIAAVVEADFGSAMRSVREKVYADYGHVGGIDKFSTFVSDVLTEGWERGLRSPSLEKLCNLLLDYAGRMSPKTAMPDMELPTVAKAHEPALE